PRAAAGARLERQLAAVALEEHAREEHAEAEPATRWLRREERLADLAAHVVGDPGAAVLDPHLQPCRVVMERELHALAGAARVERVLDQRDERLHDGRGR